MDYTDNIFPKIDITPAVVDIDEYEKKKLL